MAITKLTNTQINTLVNNAYKQATGQETMETALDLSAFCDRGTNEIGADLREKFFGALLGAMTKMWFIDESYRSEYRDVWYEDAEQFGAITQLISVEIPEAQTSKAWTDFQSGVSQVGVYTVFIPQVTNRLFTKSSSWEIPLTLSNEQIDTAFRNASELTSFISFIWLCLDNKIVEHIENMNAENRNAFIAAKVDAQNNNVDGIHVIDLVKLYVDETGRTTAMSVEEFLNDAKALRFAVEKIKLYIGYMKKQTALFNTAGKVRFTPADRLVVQMLSFFTARYDAVAQSDTFHNELTALPLFDEVSAWQSIADTSFDGVSSINVKITDEDGAVQTVEVGGVIGLVADKVCCAHTIRKNRIGHQHFDIENLEHYVHQFRDSYMIVLEANAIVFRLDDYTPAQTQS